MGSPLWVRLSKPRARWHRIRLMSVNAPHITTYCGRHPEGLTDGYKSTSGLMPLGLTCRSCAPLSGWTEQ